jgi:hypothetical protein
MKRFRLIPAEAIWGELRLPVQITSVFSSPGQPRYQKKPRPVTQSRPKTPPKPDFAHKFNAFY